MVSFKQKCIRCKKNFVLMSSSRQLAICFSCQMKDVDSVIDDPLFNKMFDIPRSFYEENSFLRSIRSQYARFKNLSKNQIEAFRKTVKEMKKEKK